MKFQLPRIFIFLAKKKKKALKGKSDIVILFGMGRDKASVQAEILEDIGEHYDITQWAEATLVGYFIHIFPFFRRYKEIL